MIVAALPFYGCVVKGSPDVVVAIVVAGGYIGADGTGSPGWNMEGSNLTGDDMVDKLDIDGIAPYAGDGNVGNGDCCGCCCCFLS